MKDNIEKVYESLLNDWYPSEEKEDDLDEARTLEVNWKGFASRFDRGLEALEDAIELIRDDKKWFKKVESLLNQLDKLGDQMNKEMGM